jgi:hypothetical protein
MRLDRAGGAAYIDAYVSEIVPRGEFATWRGRALSAATTQHLSDPGRSGREQRRPEAGDDGLAEPAIADPNIHRVVTKAV